MLAEAASETVTAGFLLSLAAEAGSAFEGFLFSTVLAAWFGSLAGLACLCASWLRPSFFLCRSFPLFLLCLVDLREVLGLALSPSLQAGLALRGFLQRLLDPSSTLLVVIDALAFSALANGSAGFTAPGITKLFQVALSDVHSPIRRQPFGLTRLWWQLCWRDHRLYRDRLWESVRIRVRTFLGIRLPRGSFL